MRTLMLAENLPFPTCKGGDLRNWQNVDALCRLGEVGVFGLCTNDRRTAKPRADLALWQSCTDPDLALPPPPARRALVDRWLLDPEGHPCDASYSPAAAREVERVVADFAPDVVVVERLWLYRYIAHARASGARVVLDDHNVEAELARELADDGDEARPGRAVRRELALRTHAIEARALAAADQVWVCSDRDRILLRRRFSPRSAVHVVPNGVEIAAYDAPRGAPMETTLLFPGMFGYAPNVNAAHFLIGSVLPELGRMGIGCKLVLAGSMPTPAMHDAARRDSRIVVTGAVPDMRPYLRAASAVLVPLFEGSGTRLKILEAFAAHAPVITTTKGAEGLDMEDGVHALVAHSAVEFASAIRRIETEDRLAQRLARNGHELVARRYSWEAARHCIADAMAELRREGVPA